MNNLLIEQIAFPLGDFLFGTSFIKHLKKLRLTVCKSELDLIEGQKRSLNNLLLAASEKSRYYKTLNIPYNPDPYVWLKNFPILNKGLLREYKNDLLTEPQENLIKNGSSGSTGEQSIVYWSKEEQSIFRATQILWWEWSGYKMGKPIIQTGINPNRTFEKKVKDKLLQTYYLQAFAHSKEDVIKAFNWGAKQNELFIGGYASSLYVLSQMAKNGEIDLQVKSAIAWGDKLFDHYRREIEDTFHTKVYETYGSAEGLMMAAQYDQPWMYIMTPNVYLEIVDDNGNEVPDGELGHVIVTNLNAYAMPLIRYRIGDLAIKLPKEKYPENRKLQLPLLQKVIGRDTDLVKTRSGKFMVVHSFTGVFEHLPEITQFCVIQENLDGITIKYIPGNGFRNEILRAAKDKLLSFLNEPFEIAFEQVDYIPPTPSGKPQLIISKLSKN